MDVPTSELLDYRNVTNLHKRLQLISPGKGINHSRIVSKQPCKADSILHHMCQHEYAANRAGITINTKSGSHVDVPWSNIPFVALSKVSKAAMVLSLLVTETQDLQSYLSGNCVCTVCLNIKLHVEFIFDRCTYLCLGVSI